MQQVARKVFQVCDADAPVTAVPLVQLLGFEMMAVRRCDFFPRVLIQGLGTGGWGLARGLRPRVLPVDLSDAAAKIG
jgi:hypothetical protein